MTKKVKETTTTTNNQNNEKENETMKKNNQTSNQSNNNNNTNVVIVETPDIKNPLVLKAINHFSITTDEMKERDSALHNENAYGAWLYLRLCKQSNDLSKAIKTQENIVKSDKKRKEQKDLAIVLKQEYESQKKDIDALKGELLPVVSDSITTEIAIVAYGAGKCDTLRLNKETSDAIIKNCRNIARYGKQHLELMQKIVSGDTKQLHGAFYVNLRKEILTVYKMLLPDMAINVRGADVADLCGKLCKFYTAQSNGGKSEQGYKYTSGETVLRNLCQYLTVPLNKMSEIEIPEMKTDEKQEEKKEEEKEQK